ncbi:MAG: cyclase family protein [Armatimonadota bacterium]|nr:cyclase family protein [Armatimonadota bacterium]MDR7454553.1 cyclase family protein [Armatimonadota bacterium]MDR7457110.1 cyclase family protein [Armatimonadota bacterium]MDR7496596.1 cyclase family protein [Armatimonadota bacterium]MDR7510618.1 cyclase family protein [Armatimonadota bacterium]
MKLYDISRPVSSGTAVWPGDQQFEPRWTMHQESGHSVTVAAVTMSVHTGTHADAPFHFDPDGRPIGAVALEPYLGPAVVVEVHTPHIGLAEVEAMGLAGFRRVLFKTRASAVPASEWDTEFPYLTEQAAQWLADQGMLLVGTDAPSVDAFSSRALLAHKALARGGVAILEWLDLAAVPPGAYELIAIPLKLVGLDASPVRAVLRPLDGWDGAP